jgi:hypothetical protein
MSTDYNAGNARRDIFDSIGSFTGNPVACDQVAYRWIKAFIRAGDSPTCLLVDARDAAHACSADSDEVYDFV